MFGFGEVRTHLGVVFSDAFRIFEGFGCRRNQKNLGNVGGPTLRRRDPTP